MSRAARVVIADLPPLELTEAEMAALVGAGKDGRRLGVESLEERLVLTWGGVPPEFVSVPSTATAVTLTALGSASGSTTVARGEVDWYRFTAQATGSYTFAATTPTSTLDTVMAAYTSSGRRVGFNDDAATGNTDSRMTLDLAAGQSYLFGVTNFTGSPNGAYNWSVSRPVIDDGWEHNDTIAQAKNLGAVTAGRTVTNLALADGADWFRFNTTSASPAGSRVSIAFRNDQGNLDLNLYNARGVLLARSATAGNGETISLAGRPAGTYFVQVVGTANPAYSLSVGRANAAPVVGTIADVNARHDTPITVTLPATDADGDRLTFSAEVLNASAPVTASLAGNSLRLTPATGFVGSFDVRVTVGDGQATATRTFRVNVTNAAPAIGAMPGVSRRHDSGDVSVPLSATDADGDAVTFTAAVVGGQATAAVRDGKLVVTPGVGYVGDVVVEVTAGDGIATSGRTFVLTMTNAAPTVVAASDIAVAAGTETVTLDVTIADADGDAVRGAATISSPAGSLVFPVAELNGSTLTVRLPAGTAPGRHVVRVTATDGLATTERDIVFVVAGPARLALPGVIDVGTAEGALSIDPLGSGDRFAGSTLAANVLGTDGATARVVDGRVVLTPAAGFAGSFVLVVTLARDGVSESQAVRVVVRGDDFVRTTAEFGGDAVRDTVVAGRKVLTERTSLDGRSVVRTTFEADGSTVRESFESGRRTSETRDNGTGGIVATTWNENGSSVRRTFVAGSQTMEESWDGKGGSRRTRWEAAGVTVRETFQGDRATTKEEWDGKGGFARTAWDGAGNVLKQTYRGDTQTLDEAWSVGGGYRRTRWEDTGEITRESYQGGKMLLSEVWRDGGFVRVAWEAEGVTLKQTYDGTRLHVEEAWDGKGGYRRTTWNADGTTLRETFADGKVRLTEAWDAAGGQVRVTYDPAGQTIRQTFRGDKQTLEESWDTSGGYRRTTWNADGSTLRETFAGGKIRLKEEWATGGAFVRTGWDESGNVIRQTFQGQKQTTEEAWDTSAGFRRVTWKADGTTVRETFQDGKIRARETWDTAGGFVREAWDDKGNVFRQTFREGKQTADEAWNTTSGYRKTAWAASGATTRETYQAGSLRLREEWDGKGGFVRTAWDGTGKCLKQTYAADRQTMEESWDGAKGYLRVQWFAGGASSRETFDDGKLRLKEEWSATGGFVRTGWDTSGNVLKQTYAAGKQTREDAWDNAGGSRHTTWTGAAVLRETFTAGKQVLREEWDGSGGFTRIGWDGAGRSYRQTYRNNAQTRDEKWDGKGNYQVTEWTSAKTSRRSFDAKGEKLREEWAGTSFVRNAWNDAGDSKRDTFSNGKLVTVEQWDAAGRSRKLSYNTSTGKCYRDEKWAPGNKYQVTNWYADSTLQESYQNNTRMLWEEWRGTGYIRHAWDGNGNSKKETYSGGRMTLLEQWSAAGYTLRNSYSASTGSRYREEKWAPGNKYQVTNWNSGSTVRQTYEGGSERFRETWAGSSFVRNAWDGKGNSIRETFENGAMRKKEAWDAAGNSMRDEWNASGKQTLAIVWDNAGKSRETHWYSDGSCRVSYYQNGSEQFRQTWDAQGRYNEYSWGSVRSVASAATNVVNTVLGALSGGRVGFGLLDLAGGFRDTWETITGGGTSIDVGDVGNIDNLVGGLSNTFKETTQIGDSFKDLNNLFSGNWGAIDFSKWVDVGGIGANFGNTFSDAWKNFGGGFSDAWKDFGGGLSSAWKDFGGDFSTAWKDFGGKFSEGWKDFGGNFSDAWKTFGGNFSDMWKDFGGKFADGWKDFGGNFSEGWKDFGGNFSEGWKDFGDKFSEGWKEFGGTLSEIWKTTGGGLSDMWKELGGNVSDGWKEAGKVISAGWDRFTDWASDRWEAAFGDQGQANGKIYRISVEPAGEGKTRVIADLAKKDGTVRAIRLVVHRGGAEIVNEYVPTGHDYTYGTVSHDFVVGTLQAGDVVTVELKDRENDWYARGSGTIAGPVTHRVVIFYDGSQDPANQAKPNTGGTGGSTTTTTYEISTAEQKRGFALPYILTSAGVNVDSSGAAVIELDVVEFTDDTEAEVVYTRQDAQGRDIDANGNTRAQAEQWRDALVRFRDSREYFEYSPREQYEYYKNEGVPVEELGTFEQWLAHRFGSRDGDFAVWFEKTYNVAKYQGPTLEMAQAAEKSLASGFRAETVSVKAKGAAVAEGLKIPSQVANAGAGQQWKAEVTVKEGSKSEPKTSALDQVFNAANLLKMKDELRKLNAGLDKWREAYKVYKAEKDFQKETDMLRRLRTYEAIKGIGEAWKMSKEDAEGLFGAIPGVGFVLAAGNAYMYAKDGNMAGAVVEGSFALLDILAAGAGKLVGKVGKMVPFGKSGKMVVELDKALVAKGEKFIAEAYEQGLRSLKATRTELKAAGMDPQHAKRLAQFAHLNEEMVIVRASNPNSLQYHGKSGFLPKPLGIKWKTDGGTGLVKGSKMADGTFHDAAGAATDYVVNSDGRIFGKGQAGKDTGFRLTSDGFVVDGQGNKFFGDYDLLGVYEESTKAPGKFTAVAAGEAFQSKLNEAVAPKLKMFQHGANDDFWKNVGGNVEQGNPYIGDTFIVAHPDGRVEVVGLAKLYEMYTTKMGYWPGAN